MNPDRSVPAAPPERGASPAPPPTAPPARGAPLDRGAVERVLARAAELQVATPDAPGLLSEEQIMELGQEVGLSPAALRQALAEERSRVVTLEEEGTAGRLFGPRAAAATRTVRGTPERVLATLDLWMQRDECLRVRRRFADRLTWEPRRDLWGSLRRGLNLGGRSYDLSRATEVGATVIPVDDGRVLVRLDADLAPSRRTMMQMGGATAATGVATGGVLAVIATVAAAPGPLGVVAVVSAATLPSLAGLGGGWAVARQHRGVVTRVQLGLEQVLDRLEHERADVGVVVPVLGRIL
ncbi:MAG TPA: hypothetical protein VFX39_01530 [Gemmatimonadaceae bacterium]|nr:hypothetical protein [Gemmatimonadaceae bacterium]